MHYVRNIICFIVLVFVGCLFYLNTSTGKSYVKEWLQTQIQMTNGMDVRIGDVEFDLPRSFVLKDVYIPETPYGAVKVEKITLTAPFLKLIFGNLNEGQVHLEGFSAKNEALAALPSELQAYVAWDSGQSTLEGEIFLLESKNEKFPYRLLDKVLFKISLSENQTLAAEGFFDKLIFQDYMLEDASVQGEWDLAKQEGRFNLVMDRAERQNLLQPNTLFNMRGLMVTGHWDGDQELGSFTFAVNEVEDQGLALANSIVSAEGLQGKGGWDPQRQALHFSFTLNEVEQRDTLNLKAPVISNGIIGHGEWNLAQGAGGISLAIEELLGEHFSIANATLDASSEGSPNEWKYVISSEGVYDDSFVVSLAGSVVLAEELYRLEIHRFNGVLAEHVLSLVEPLKCTLYRDFNFDLSQSHFLLDGKEFQLSGQGNQNTVDFSLKLPKQPIDQLLAGENQSPPLSGELSGELSLRGPYTGLQGQLSLALEEISVDHSSVDKASTFGVYFSAVLTKNLITLSGAVNENATRLLELQGICPVEKSGYFLEPSKTQEMSLSLFGEIDLARYMHALAPPTVWATGRSAIDVRLSGLYKAPELYGNIKLIDCNFEQWKTGTLLHHVNADFDLHNDKILLQSLSAYDALGGNVTAVGELDLTSALDYPFHIDIAVNQASVVDIDNLQAVLSGTMSFVGSTKGALIKGELVTDRLDFTLNNTSSSVEHDVEVEYVNQSHHEAPPTQNVKPSGKWPVCFDLHVVNGENILIHSEEFTSEWKGDIKVTGCNTQPLINGDFRILHGEFGLPDYLFPGKKFKISQGTITFAGELNKKTSLYIVGEMEIEHIVAQVIVKGPLSDPTIAFRSNPPLSQREILSWILFGRGMGDITSYQGAELTQSFNQLKRSNNNAPASNNPSFLTSLTRLKENLGIDRIGIDRTNTKDGKEEISVQVGKYILPEVFLGVKRNMSSDVNRIGLEANLRKNLKLEAEVGDDTDGRLHLKWKHDY